MGIAMRKMFDKITETPNTPITDVNELEARITDNYKKSCDIALRYANDNVDDNYATMYMDALDTEAEYLINQYKKIYPNAGNEDMMDEYIYTTTLKRYRCGQVLLHPMIYSMLQKWQTMMLYTNVQYVLSNPENL